MEEQPLEILNAFYSREKELQPTETMLLEGENTRIVRNEEEVGQTYQEVSCLGQKISSGKLDTLGHHHRKMCLHERSLLANQSKHGLSNPK